MTVGYVSKNQVPMIMTFKESEAEMIIGSLAHALEQSYAIIDFFDFDNYNDEE